MLPFLRHELIPVPPTVFRTTTGHCARCAPFVSLVIRATSDGHRLTELPAFIKHAHTDPVSLKTKLKSGDAAEACRALIKEATDTLIPIHPIPWTEGPKHGWCTELKTVDREAALCGWGPYQRHSELPATIEMQVVVSVESVDKKMGTFVPSSQPRECEDIQSLRKLLTQTIKYDGQGD